MAHTSSASKTARLSLRSNGHQVDSDAMDDRSSSPDQESYSRSRYEKPTRSSRKLDTDGNGEETDKRKRPMRFSGQHDIRLLEEVVSLNPFKDTPPTTTWALISKNLGHLFSISSRRCRERTILLLDQFIKGDYPSLQRFCTTEEFAVKEQLLQQAPLKTTPFALIFAMVILFSLIQESVEHEMNGTSTKEQTSSTSAPPSKRSRHAGGPSPFSGNGGGVLTDDDAGLEELAVSAALGDAAKGADFPSQVVSYLVTRQAKEMRVREKELKLRREELELERAKLKLQEDRLALEKARFEIERQERELRLRSEKQERTLFMEVLKRVVSSGLADS
ncbi:uncharacterized protein LOC119381729 [Rhipicephalus sanguineus]|nr:uncharacterized protein LOC119381729 [Rhipicephalus sanguineus]